MSEVILCLLWFVRALGLAKKLASLAEPISTRELKQLSRPYTRRTRPSRAELHFTFLFGSLTICVPFHWSNSDFTFRSLTLN